MFKKGSFYGKDFGLIFNTQVHKHCHASVTLTFEKRKNTLARPFVDDSQVYVYIAQGVLVL